MLNIDIMGFSKRDATLDLCNRVTLLSDSISIRMLEYLSTAKSPIHGFQSLATDFLDLSRLLWFIEAGMIEATRQHTTFPTELRQELDKHLRKINDEFIVVNQICGKLIDNEKKSSFGKALRRIFADTDIDKVRSILNRSKDALRMSSAVLQWVVKDTKLDLQMGIGYTGLAAALERLDPRVNNTLPAVQLPPPPPPPSKQPLVQTSTVEWSPAEVEQQPLNRLPSQRLERSPTRFVQPPPVPIWDQQYVHSLHRDEHAIAPASVDRRTLRTSSVQSDTIALSVQDIEKKDNALSNWRSGYAAHSSDKFSNSRTIVDDEPHNLRIVERLSNDVPYPRHDSPVSPRWPLKQADVQMPTSDKSALVNAVQLRKHRMLEQLLQGGASTNARGNASMLRMAAQNRDIESIALLLQYGADANSPDMEGCTPLYSATTVQFLEGAKLLLQAGADPNLSTGPDSLSPFCLAACENHIDLVQLYLSHGGDADLVMESGTTTLIKCQNTTVSSDLVELLLKSGADANAKDGDGTTALFQAIQANRVDLMTVLLDNGANPNLPGPKHPLWPSTYKPKALQLLLSRGADSKKAPGIMELASSLKRMESISILTAAGVSPNVKKDGIYTPLCSAIRDNSGDIVTYLLANGADPNLKASEYPAFKCITHDRVHFLPQLVAAGADLNSPKGIIETAVAHNNKDALLYLLKQGVNPNDRIPNGNTALTTAIRNNNVELVELLLANGADPVLRGTDWPLCMAVKRPHILEKLLEVITHPRAFRGVIEMAVVANELDSVKMLIGAGVSVEDKNCGVFSPLTTAIREGHKHIVRYLLDEAGADANAPGEHLPIVKALRRYVPGDMEVLQMLLTHGADINKMYRGWNAVLQAVENGDADVLRLLIEEGGPVDLQAVDEYGTPVVDIVTERGLDEGFLLLFPNIEEKQQ